MVKNRMYALIFRLAAFCACLYGVLDTTGVFRGQGNGGMLLYYTSESNVLVTLMFAALAVRTAVDIIAHGSRGPASYFERLSAIVMLAITVTMLIFWVLLAPSITDLNFLSSYLNLQIHLFTPLLMIIDYFCFATPGKLKRSDPLLFALIPLAYFIQATILGFSGFIYRPTVGAESHFPYFFLDFYQLGPLVFVYCLPILAFFVGLAYGLLWLDRWRAAHLNLR
jgi:hypothetical protein